LEKKNLCAIEFDNKIQFKKQFFIWNMELFFKCINRIKEIAGDKSYFIEFQGHPNTFHPLDLAFNFNLFNIGERKYCFFIYEPKIQLEKRKDLGNLIYLFKIK